MSPPRPHNRTVPADDHVRRGRLTKARQFLAVADDARDLHDSDETVADACVTLYVHAGIAAADAVCARHLGRHAKGQSHEEAVQLLAMVDRTAAQDLSVLLGMKTRAGYGHDSVTATQVLRASRLASRLVDLALT
ncbi:hypothetical protein [Corynebacterium sp.]|uniref:hypothetical protein n=1 Tax=Corynebacterium sp. TaxID=1720 RepID=UPI0026E05148|nr:hypothetical protein [Corynebacterium sp.]MDO5512210.1 hypothetical protein [Corynebacterium sp.]